jgi:hypothetical protein
LQVNYNARHKQDFEDAVREYIRETVTAEEGGRRVKGQPRYNPLRRAAVFPITSLGGPFGERTPPKAKEG